jgi:hypothetical protein
LLSCLHITADQITDHIIADHNRTFCAQTLSSSRRDPQALEDGHHLDELYVAFLLGKFAELLYDQPNVLRWSAMTSTASSRPVRARSICSIATTAIRVRVRVKCLLSCHAEAEVSVADLDASGEPREPGGEQAVRLLERDSISP